MSADFAIIIPARYASQRYPGKPLVELRGVTGEARSLVRRTWDTATAIARPDLVWVATDDARIADHVKTFGGQVVRTPVTCNNGTERCAAALEVLGDVAPIIVNLQGDAPLTPPNVVLELVNALAADEDAVMTTPAVRCSPTTYHHLVNDQAQGHVGGTTVVFTTDRRALYFSKRVIPYISDKLTDAHEQVHMHLGVYAYRPAALRQYAEAPPSKLEQFEGLEQLRFLETGKVVRIVPIAEVDRDCIELNNPHDVAVIEKALRELELR